MKPLRHPEPQHIHLSAVLYALSDPVRLEIVRTLAGCKERACGAFDLPIAKSTASHHFKVLREAGVIQMRCEGVQRHTSLRRKDLNQRFPRLLAAVLQAANAER